MTFSVDISANFEGGNIEFVEMVADREIMPVVRVNVRPDLYTELEKIHHMQYFCFKATAKGDLTQDVKVRYVLANAGKVSYPEAWPDTTVCYTTTEDYQNVDEEWRRNLTTRYVGEELVWEHTHTVDKPTVYFSYFPPYTYKRHCEFIQECQAVANAKVSVLGQSKDGNDLHYISVGSGPLQAWVIHRQHPGETMAEHYAEGLVRRLLCMKGSNNEKDDDTVVEKLLNDYTFHIIPCMCPDGAIRGHLRTNGVGANLNREWATVHEHYPAPTMERSPEVYLVWQKMVETGVDFFLDVHGDEELPYNFISGAEHVPTWGPRMQALHGALVASYHRANKAFQAYIGYPPSPSPEETARHMGIATNAVAAHFDCLAATLEMPFKDCQSDSEPEVGWNPARCRRLGESLLDVLTYLQPHLRSADSWATLPPEDAYIEPTDDYNDFKPLSKRYFSDVREIHGRVPKAI